MGYEVLSSKEVYRGKLATIQQDVVKMPDNSEAMRETVIWKDASAIVPIDEDGNIIFVRQYRQSFQDMFLEIPAGKIEKGEDPLECAKRELEEETGYRSENIHFLCEVYTAVAFCSQKVFLYEAKNLRKGKQNFDEDEFIEIERFSLEEAVSMIFNGQIKDGKTIVAILAYKNSHK